jgi:hypothetical protein
MIDEDLSGTAAGTDGSQSSSEMFMPAIAEVVRLTLALTSANATLAFSDGVQIRGELERALPDAQRLAERIADGSKRAEALRELGEMQSVAKRALMLAPSPSEAALRASEAGDRGAWLAEEQAWITVRMANGTGSPATTQRRERRATRPERPNALHSVFDDAQVDDPTSEPQIVHPRDRDRT